MAAADRGEQRGPVLEPGAAHHAGRRAPGGEAVEGGEQGRAAKTAGEAAGHPLGGRGERAVSRSANRSATSGR